MIAAGLLLRLLAAPMAILADLESTGEGRTPQAYSTTWR
jgi:hypothetical protein